MNLMNLINVPGMHFLLMTGKKMNLKEYAAGGKAKLLLIKGIH